MIAKSFFRAFHISTMKTLLNTYRPVQFSFSGAQTNPLKKKNIEKMEWLETSGDGSYASSTVDGTNSRVYHGLLASSKNAPVERNIILQRIDDDVTVNGKNLKISNVAYGGMKDGYNKDEMVKIKDFTTLPVPTWQYDLGENKSLKKQLVMPEKVGSPEVVTGYTYDAPKGSEPITIKVRPFVNNRSIHGGNNGVKEWYYSRGTKGAVVNAKRWDDSVEPTYLAWSKTAKINDKGQYYNDYYYQREADRGLQNKEDGVYQPLELEVTLKPGETFSFMAATSPITREVDANKEVSKKAERLEGLYKQSGLPRSKTIDNLQRAADQFVVHRNSINGKTIMAGYHWFNDWGRDTMISLPGLTLTTKRFDDAKSIMTTFAKYSHNGMLPNNFPEGANDRPGYNTLDASMWWFNALDQYTQAAGDKTDMKFVKEQYTALKDVVKHHMYGRLSADELAQQNPQMKGIVAKGQGKLPVGDGNSGIGMDKDGLITADDGQLTWMDSAKWDPWAKKSHPYTPRDGKAVEINALWYNGLRVMADLAEKFGEKENAKQYTELADIVKVSMQKFKNPKGGLYDLIETPNNPEYRECRGRQVRPNQIFAASLKHSAFDKETQKDIVKTVQDKLLTPYGLRSLAKDEEGYAPYYPNGNSDTRDAVYHQGTVWSWQIGHFCDAYLNAYGDTKEAKEKVTGFIKPLLNHMSGKVEKHADSGCCIGGIAEIFDAEGDFHSKGTVNQAWSVAEVLRTYDRVKDVAKFDEETKAVSKPEVKAETKPVVKAEVKEEPKTETKAETKPVVEAEVKEEQKTEAKTVTNTVKENKAEVKSETNKKSDMATTALVTAVGIAAVYKIGKAIVNKIKSLKQNKAEAQQVQTAQAQTEVQKGQNLQKTV